MIVIVFGLPGSGKTYFAERVAHMLHAAYISSDEIRRELFKQSSSYAENEKALVYEEMMKRMLKTATYKEVVLDATFSDIEIRQKFINEAKKNSRVCIIEIYADEDLIKQRLLLPRKNSDANFEVYKKIKSKWRLPKNEHLILRSTNSNITEMLDKASDYFFQNEPGKYK